MNAFQTRLAMALLAVGLLFLALLWTNFARQGPEVLSAIYGIIAVAGFGLGLFLSRTKGTS